MPAKRAGYRQRLNLSSLLKNWGAALARIANLLIGILPAREANQEIGDPGVALGALPICQLAAKGAANGWGRPLPSFFECNGSSPHLFSGSR
jgi:hypothetical protein